MIISPWGSSKGPSREAYERLLDDNYDIGWIYSVALNPIPEEVFEALKNSKCVLVPELNFQGQWSSLLRQDGIKAQSVIKYDGTPFRPGELVKKITYIFDKERKK